MSNNQIVDNAWSTQERQDNPFPRYLLESDFVHELYHGEIYNFADVVVEIVDFDQARIENIKIFGEFKEFNPIFISRSFHLDVIECIPREFRDFYSFDELEFELERRIFKAGLEELLTRKDKSNAEFCVRASHPKANFQGGIQHWFIKSQRDVLDLAKLNIMIHHNCDPFYYQCLWALTTGFD